MKITWSACNGEASLLKYSGKQVERQPDRRKRQHQETRKTQSAAAVSRVKMPAVHLLFQPWPFQKADCGAQGDADTEATAWSIWIKKRSRGETPQSPASLTPARAGPRLPLVHCVCPELLHSPLCHGAQRRILEEAKVEQNRTDDGSKGGIGLASPRILLIHALESQGRKGRGMSVMDRWR